jgi:hypothetical protein
MASAGHEASTSRYVSGLRCANLQCERKAAIKDSRDHPSTRPIWLKSATTRSPIMPFSRPFTAIPRGDIDRTAWIFVPIAEHVPAG